MKKTHYKSVFISDIHLGNPKNQSDKLIKFLDSISMDNLIIVGDYIDFRQIKWFGKRTDKEINTINYINHLSNTGTKVTYIQGNHDRKLECLNNIHLDNISITNDLSYKTTNGKSYYVIHGDNLDSINSRHSFIGRIGSFFYGLLLKIENLWNKNAILPGRPSIAETIEDWIKIHRFPKNKLLNKIKSFSYNHNYDGIIVGHFHQALHENINGLDFFNTGDWLKNCSAVVEKSNGELELLSFSQ